jgi:hypothetical protein
MYISKDVDQLTVPLARHEIAILQIHYRVDEEHFGRYQLICKRDSLEQFISKCAS